MISGRWLIAGLTVLALLAALVWLPHNKPKPTQPPADSFIPQKFGM